MKEWTEMELNEIVQYYDVDLRQLLKSQKSKMKRFIRENCIEYIGRNIWIVKPIKGYNKTTYTITFDEFKGWDCNCQFKSLEGIECSHIGAVKLWLLRKANCVV